MRAVRLMHAIGLSAQMTGDRDAVLLLTEADAFLLVQSKLAEYVPEWDPEPSFVGPETAAARLEQLKAAVELQGTPVTVTEFPGDDQRQAVQDLVGMTEDLGLYDDPPHARHEDAAEPGDLGLYEEVNRPHQLRDLEEELAEPMTMPWTNAAKAEWVEWAVYRGCARKTAELLTKTQLMGRYGERL